MTYKKISVCPAELEGLISQLNQLPLNLERLENDLTVLGLKFNADLLKKPESTTDLMKTYANKLRKLIAPGLVIEELAKGDFVNGKFQIMRLINEKITLIRVINAYQQAFFSFNNLKVDWNFDKSIASFSFNEDSTIHLSSFRVIEILTRNKITVERIKICPICNNIFWAKKIVAPTCSGVRKCSNKFHQTKSRIKEYESSLSNEKHKLAKLSGLSRDNGIYTTQFRKVQKIEKQIKENKLNISVR